MENTITYSIGQVAALTGVSDQTLRYYDRIGLLKPEIIDPANGYRHYSPVQLKTLNVIARLKELGLSLRQIKEALDEQDVRAVFDLLHAQEAVVDQEIDDLFVRRELIERTIENLEIELTYSGNYEVTPKICPLRRFLALRDLHQGEIGYLEVSINELLRKTRRLGFSIESNPILIFADTPEGIRIRHVAVEVLGNLKEFIPSDTRQGDAGLFVMEVPAGTYLSCYQRGNMQDIRTALDKIRVWAQGGGLVLEGDPMEVLLVDYSLVSERQHLLTEVQWRVK
ncbi:MerR family transcriptional regulator [Anaerotalea alkaliphila]|uniref:MerR family transcriptional regulator n=1 Tax=Anaerotalea alkaliphila TaxID=2662126 RepID=A0A7X5HX68_9FIRM|nr:MerR family transcriptional regulator [Anaerotalea alkaliphila]NDL68323.1 MerR family transcriptional regulator [Anaerotalea alkaliphila]